MSFNLLVVLIVLGGWISGRLFFKTGLPSILGMLVWGIAIGTFFNKNQIPDLLWNIEPFLKSAALIIILLRAGLGINKKTLSKFGKTSLLMATVPCVVEGIVLTFLFSFVFGFSLPVAALAAFMIAAVSPAVIVPSMLELKDKGFGKKNEVPTVILASASVDDVLAITIFSIVLSYLTGESQTVFQMVFSLPRAIILGVIPGVVAGFGLVWFFKKRIFDTKAIEQALIILMISIMLVQIGALFHSAALIGVMTIGFILVEKQDKVATEISLILKHLWVPAEIVLFVLIGMAVDISLAFSVGLKGFWVILAGLVFRSCSVFFVTYFSKFSIKERIFCVLAFIPKATVQAALGSVALHNSIENGETILALAVLSIIFTAPVGAISIKFFGKKLLNQQI